MPQMKLAVFAGMVAAAVASCPNDCNGQGVCNIYSACECYRNWMGADCSQRVCYFDAAFVDTPQGDLNSDGRTDRADVYGVEVTKSVDCSVTDFDFSANAIAAGLYLDTAANAVNGVDNKGITASSTTPTCNQAGDALLWTLPVYKNDGSVPSFTAAANVFSALITNVAADGSTAAAQTQVNGNNIEFVGNTPARLYTYETQFANKDTWELYPTNHGVAAPASTQKIHWDEAHFYSECSGKGTCDRSTGTCECYPGYTGEGCTRTSCPNDCSGHGVCSRLHEVSAAYNGWDAKKTQTCECDSGYTGIDCASRICPSGDDPITRDQDAEVQTIAFASGTTGDMALEFTDEFGDMWTTKTFDITSADSVVEAALEALPNNVIQDCTVARTGDPSAEAWSFAITFDTNTGDIPDLLARYSVDTDAGATVTDSDGDFDGTSVSIAETTKGNTENAICSNRGICDYQEGLCRCFNGFTDDDCSVQNALAMY